MKARGPKQLSPMIRHRDKPDGLPSRVYERFGKRTYSIGYKTKSGAWAFRLDCPVADAAAIKTLRAEAKLRAAQLELAPPTIEGTFGALADAYLTWQEQLPYKSADRKADSTLAENRREVANLKKSFGSMAAAELRKSDAYLYLQACAAADRAAKGNKEISLARTILEYGIKIGQLEVNPFDGVERNKTVREARYVSDEDLDLALRVGRSKGGARLVVALALQCAWLCVRRSVEVRALTLQQITDAGIEWQSGKRRKTDLPQTVLIEWTPALRACIDEARAVKRDKVAGTMYVFGNMRGQRYTKGGWKAMLDDLMTACEETAAREGVPFKRFNLQDCRPKGASDKLATQQQDTQDALGHTDGRMLALHYDRRRVKVAKPVR